MRKAPKILSKLKPSDPLYKEKVIFLCELIKDPDVGNILNDNLVEWAKQEGLKPECNCEDHCAWWTCNDN